MSGSAINNQQDARRFDAFAQQDTLDASPKEPAASHETDNPTGAPRRGRFLLLRKLGEGGMGEVFAAYDEQLDRRVAIKLLRPDDVSEEARRRLLREAQALAKLAHPNVVTVFEAGQIDNDVFLAMEFVDGVTLQDWQVQAGRTIDDILKAYVACGEGLAAVHAAGLVHRDFKPTNVMMGKDERVRILDFGLAHGRTDHHEKIENISEHLVTLESKLTMTGALVGTPAYMSPEQYLGEPLDARSDQFSFCIALHEALYGQHPFGKGNIHEMLSNLLEGKLLPAPTNSTVPAKVAEALSRGLARNPNLRFDNMPALLERLVELPNIDKREHPLQRILFGIGLPVIAILVLIQSIATGKAPLYSPTKLFQLAMTAVVVLSAGIILFRKTLMKNQFHRIMAYLGLVTMILFAVSRGIGILQHETGTTIVQRDFLIACSGATIAALFWSSVSPWIWLNVAITMASALGMTLFPSHVGSICVAGFNFLALSYIFIWRQLAQSTQALVSGMVYTSGASAQVSKKNLTRS